MAFIWISAEHNWGLVLSSGICVIKYFGLNHSRLKGEPNLAIQDSGFSRRIKENRFTRLHLGFSAFCLMTLTYSRNSSLSVGFCAYLGVEWTTWFLNWRLETIKCLTGFTSLNAETPLTCWDALLRKTTAGILFLYFFLLFFHQLFTELLNSLFWSHFLWHWSTSVSPGKFSSHCYQVVVPHSLTPISTFTLYETAWGQTLSTACTQAHKHHLKQQELSPVAAKTPPVETQEPFSTPTPSPEICLSFGITHWFQDWCHHSVDEVQA